MVKKFYIVYVDDVTKMFDIYEYERVRRMPKNKLKDYISIKDVKPIYSDFLIFDNIRDNTIDIFQVLKQLNIDIRQTDWIYNY